MKVTFLAHTNPHFVSLKDSKIFDIHVYLLAICGLKRMALFCFPIQLTLMILEMDGSLFLLCSACSDLCQPTIVYKRDRLLVEFTVVIFFRLLISCIFLGGGGLIQSRV